MKKQNIIRIIGLAGTLVSVSLFIISPSWPTPDKLLIFAVFVFMIFGQGLAVLKKLGPFVALLLVYESFRGMVPKLNTRVNFMWMPEVDRAMFGQLPTATLQSWLWKGSAQWYDFVFYIAYMLHFILPIALVLVVWKKHIKHYWNVITAYLTLTFSGFITYLLFPAAPPWMASEKGLIEPITRVSSSVFAALGITDFPSLYNKMSPNPVAAVPSLHSAYATLFSLFIFKIFGKKWGAVSLVYPILIYTGTVYQGEHYVIDAILGIIYAGLAFAIAPFLVRMAKKIFVAINKKVKLLQPQLATDQASIEE